VLGSSRGASLVPVVTVRKPPAWIGPVLVLTTAVLVVAAFALTRSLTAQTVADNSVPSGTGPSGASGALARHPAVPSAATGALFTRPDGHLNQHFCTASVVASKHGDVLITAAHCVTGVSLSPAGSIVFAPGYADGRFPSGLWAVTRSFVAAQWSADQNADEDVAFLVVRRLTGPGVPASQVPPDTTLQRAVGADRLRFDAPLPTMIRAIGYPDGSGAPVSCVTMAVAFRPGSLDQVKFVCPGFTDGTSGGPFLSDFSHAAGTGAIIGVIGGYQQGGDSPSISYSSAFSAVIKSLYQHVLRVAG
jgi:hypothetical protein